MELIETPNYASIRDSFTEELAGASRGSPASLPFIHNQLPTHSLVRHGEIFQSFVIGGTNGEVATLRYEPDGEVTILDHQPYPDLDKFATVEGFLSFIDDHVSAETDALGISFAAELIPVVGGKGQLDGVLNEGTTKGHGFHGLQQRRVGETIEGHFRRTHDRELTVSVGNDTVALLAAMAARGVDRHTLVAGIVGTGYNLAFFLDDHTIVNVQASDFTGFEQTVSGKLADAQSTNPGKQLYDKEVAKIFTHYNALVFAGKLPGEQIRDNKELSAIAQSAGATGDVARGLFQRSASLVAAQYASLYDFKGRPEKLTSVMQGSLYWEGPNYKEMVADELVRLGVPVGTVVFERLEHADILGAAKLVTGGL